MSKKLVSVRANKTTSKSASKKSKPNKVSVRVDHLMIRTPNIHNSVHFYKEVFGMEVVGVDNRLDREELPYLANYVATGAMDFKLELIWVPEMASGRFFIHGNILEHIGIYVDDLDEIIERAENIGYEFERVFIHPKGNEKEYKIGILRSPENVELSIIEKTKG